MNRAELQRMSNDRIDDATVLLNNGRWSAAYYLLGYAVETGLKACILKFVEESGVIFRDRKFAERCWTHRIDHLVMQADLDQRGDKTFVPIQLGVDIGALLRRGRKPAAMNRRQSLMLETSMKQSRTILTE